jgi:hypothetical protein
MADLKDLARDVRAFKGDLVKASERANKRTGEAALRLAKEMSSGLFKSPILASLNRPYAVINPGGPMPYGDPAIINKQSGTFFRSWHLRALPSSMPTLLLVNDAPYAKFLEFGTRFAVERPLDGPLQELIAKVGPQFAAEEIARAWRLRFQFG